MVWSSNTWHRTSFKTVWFVDDFSGNQLAPPFSEAIVVSCCFVKYRLWMYFVPLNLCRCFDHLPLYITMVPRKPSLRESPERSRVPVFSLVSFLVCEDKLCGVSLRALCYVFEYWWSRFWFVLFCNQWGNETLRVYIYLNSAVGSLCRSSMDVTQISGWTT